MGVRVPPLALEMESSKATVEDVTPVLVSQLRKGGIDASFKMPSDMATQVMGGDAEGFVWGGNTSVLTPDTTLKSYQNGAPPWRWSSHER